MKEAAIRNTENAAIVIVEITVKVLPGSVDNRLKGSDLSACGKGAQIHDSPRRTCFFPPFSGKGKFIMVRTVCRAIIDTEG